jgi:hypothetical protein
MALFVNDRMRGQGWTRMAYFTPTVLPMVAVANIWLFFYAPGYGPIDQLLGLVGLGDNNLLGSPRRRSGADRHHDLEGGRLLHDLLSRRPAADIADAARGGAARRGDATADFRRVTQCR